MKKQKFLRNLSAILSSITLLAAVSCTPVPYQQSGAAYGGPSGVSPGPIARNNGSNTRSGSALSPSPERGATAYQEEQERRTNQSFNSTRTYTPPSQRPTYQPPVPTLPTTPARTSTGSIPMATPSIKANTVISPYPPYNVIDITGFKSGDKLCDPSTIPNDPATGKPYINPATGREDVKRGKYFIVP